MIKANTSQNVIKFKVGSMYYASMLFGGTVRYKCINRTGDKVTFMESHVSEDDGHLVKDGTKEFTVQLADVYNNSVDEVIGQEEVVQIWEYKGNKGYLHASGN